MLFLRHHRQIGVEITPQEVRASCVGLSHRRPQWVDGIILPIQTSTMATLGQLRTWLATLKTKETKKAKKTKAIFALDYDQVLCKTIDLTATLSHAELATYCKNQVPQWFGLPAGDIFFDYEPLDHTPPTTLWQIVACKKNQVQEKIRQSQAAHLHLHALDVNWLALPRLYPYLHAVSHETIAIVYIEPLHLQFCLINQQQLIYQARSPLPAVDTPVYTQMLLTTLVHHTQTPIAIRCIYLASDPLPLRHDLHEIQAATKIPTKLIHWLADRIKINITFDTRLLTSTALALWGFMT